MIILHSRPNIELATEFRTSFMNAASKYSWQFLKQHNWSNFNKLKPKANRDARIVHSKRKIKLWIVAFLWIPKINVLFRHTFISIGLNNWMRMAHIFGQSLTKDQRIWIFLDWIESNQISFIVKHLMKTSAPSKRNSEREYSFKKMIEAHFFSFKMISFKWFYYNQLA